MSVSDQASVSPKRSAAPRPGPLRLLLRGQAGLTAIALAVLLALPGRAFPIALALGLAVLVAVALGLWLLADFVARSQAAVAARENAAFSARLDFEQALERSEALSARDPLTGLFNRRHLAAVIEQEIGRCRRGEAAFSVALIDIDGFEQVNARHGRDQGDRVLRRCAERLTENIRDIDTLGRYEEDQFLLVMPLTQGEAAATTAERLRAAIERVELGEGLQESIHIQLSAGVTQIEYSDDGSTELLFGRADAALKQAKQAGGNRIDRL